LGIDVDRCNLEPQWSDITDASWPALRAEQTVTIVPAGALNSNPRPAMTQTSNRFFDEMARLMNDAAGVASGVRREFDTMFRNQADRILRDLDVVKREEFEAVKDMARLAREENETLKARIAALEAKLGAGGNP
jgi:BMFP domain-containing protein YqiC